MSYRPKVKNDNQGTITDLPLDAETVKGVDVVAQLQNKSNVGHTHSSNDITQGYLNVHPENAPTLIPFMNNDISFLLKRGGSVVVKYDNVVQTINTDSMFDGSPSYWAMNPTNITTIVIEITLHKTFTWGNTVYVDFGSAGWRAKSIKLEVMNSNYPNDVWTQKGNTTTNASGHYSIGVSHTPVGGSNAGAGFNKIRYTFSTWNTATIFRIAQIGIYNYSSGSLRETSMSRGIDDYIFRNITPNANNTYKLGDSTHKWSEIHGALKGTADNASKLNNQEASYYLNYNNLTNKPTIPSAVTEATVSGWGFTKNTGTVTSVRVQAGTGLSSSTSTAQTSTLNTTISIASGYKLLTTAEYNTLNAKVSNVQSDWNATSGLAQILNKPTIPTKASWNYDDRYVRFDTFEQDLTDAQKAYARINIGAASSDFSYNDLQDLPIGSIKEIPYTVTSTSDTSEERTVLVATLIEKNEGVIWYFPSFTRRTPSGPYISGTYKLYAGKIGGQYSGEICTLYGGEFMILDRKNYGVAIYNSKGLIYAGEIGDITSFVDRMYIPAINESDRESNLNVGSVTKPVYLMRASYTDDHDYYYKPCSLYAGGTAVTLNGTSKAASTASFYAPTSYGSSGQFLKSAGANASPTWETVSIPSKTSDLTNDSGYTTNTGTVTSVRVQAGTGLSSSTSTASTTTLDTTISIASGYKLLTTSEYNTLNAKQDAISVGTNGQLLSSNGSSLVWTNDNRGLLYHDLVKVIENTTTDKGWKMFNDSDDDPITGFFLRSLRFQAQSPDWGVGDFGSGIVFGGGDTKGVISLSWRLAQIKFAGGNSGNGGPLWWIGLTGTSATTYDLDELSAKQDKISSLGTETKPVYFSSDGVVSACLNYGGGTKVTLNGTECKGSSATLYAPTSAGTSGYSLKSNGSGAPRWAKSRTVQTNGSISSGAKNCASVSFVITSSDTEHQLSKGLWYYSGTYGVFIVYLTTAITSPGSPKTEYISGHVSSSIPNNTTITLVEL